MLLGDYKREILDRVFFICCNVVKWLLYQKRMYKVIKIKRKVIKDIGCWGFSFKFFVILVIVYILLYILYLFQLM